MPQVKQNKNSNNRRKNIYLLIMISLGSLAVLYIIGSYTIANYEKNKTAQEQKVLLNQSLAEVNSVYYKFADSVTDEKVYSQKPSNVCSIVGSLSMHKEYGCGNRSEIQVLNTDENTYLKQSEDAVNIYKNNGAFSNIKFEKPTELSYKNGVGRIINSEYKNNNLNCYFSSVYERDNRISIFSFGCSLTASSPIYEVDD